MTEPNPRPQDTDPELQIDAIAEEYLDRLQRGEAPEKEALLSAHPEIAALLEEHLALVEMLYEVKGEEGLRGHRPGQDSGGANNDSLAHTSG